MSNQIFLKCRSHRRYIRKPLCDNKLGICEFRICRCNYAYDLKRVARGLKSKLVLAVISE